MPPYHWGPWGNRGQRRGGEAPRAGAANPEAQGAPVAGVHPTRDRLFGSRSPFALLPVGMGLSSTERDALESGLVKLRIIREMPACVSGTQFDWPQVVFESPDDAGNAVAVALQDVTCTFTVAPTPPPLPTPTPA